MAKDPAETVSLLIERVKRHPVAVIVAFWAALIVSLASLTDAIGQLSHLVGGMIGGMSREEAREELRTLGLQYDTQTYTESARNGDVRVVRLFLAAGMDVDATGGSITALMHSAANNDGKLIALLLDAGADVNYADTLGIAASSADLKNLRLLLNRQASSDAINKAFAFAAPSASSENLALLWEKVTDKKNVASQGLLNIAEGLEDNCTDDGTERVRYQLQLGADPNIKDDEGYFPLLYLSRGKCINAAQLLLDAKADVNLHCACAGWLAGGWTALLVASDHEESLPIVELLLSRGADVQAQTNDGNNALMLAVEKNNSEVVKLLVGKGADINAGDSNGVTPLMNASGRGLLDIVRLLVEAGADVNARSKRGYTSLMRAARDGNAESVRYLLEHGAAADAANEDGRSALIFAADRRSGDATAVRYLLEYKAAVNPQDREGRSALMLAAQQGNAAAVQLLLAQGAQAALKDMVGKTAADLVAISLAGDDRREDREKILFLLKQKNVNSKVRSRR